MMWVLVFLANGVALDVAAYETELDCANMASQLNPFLGEGEFNCERSD